MFSNSTRLKHKVSTLRDAFRVEALESRVLLSADPIVGMMHLILPSDMGHDHVALDSYQSPATTDVAAPASVAAAEQSDALTPVSPDPHLAGLARLSQAAAIAPDAASTVTYAPADLGVTIVLGSGAGTIDGLHLNSAELAELEGGANEIVLGSYDSHHIIYIGEAGATQAVTLNDTLHLINPKLGGEIFINTALNLNNSSSLLIDGSGHTSTFSANVTSTDDILVNDSVRFDGPGIALTAGTDGTGNIHLGFNAAQIFQGNLDGSPDSAILRGPGNITIGGEVGAASLPTGSLAGLAIEGVNVGGVLDTPNDVTFSESVIINGDLVINASGVVTFAKSVTLTNGGDFSIFGATQVIFQGGVVLSGGGDLFIEADEITFSGGGESVVGTGMMTLRPTTVGLAIEVASPPSGMTAGTLNIDNSEIATFADGFSKIVIGHQSGGHAAMGAGAVRVGAVGAVEQPTLRDNLEVYGGSIAVEDFSSPTLNYTLLVGGSIKLDAVNDIAINNLIEARSGTLQAITLYSSAGAITQSDVLADGVGAEPLRASTVDAHAALGIQLLYTELNSVSAQNTGISGDIVVHETALGGDLLITSATQSNVAGSGNIDLSTANGALSVLASGSGVLVGGTGSISLGALGSARSLLVNDIVATTSGSITLSAVGTLASVDDVINDGVISSSGGAISLVSSTGSINLGGDIASAGGLVSLQAATAIAMADGRKISSLNAGDTGAVSLLAGSGIGLSIIEADGAITLTAQNGAIVDALSGSAPNLDGETIQVTLSASTGVGAGAGLALQTRIAGLAAYNSTSGGLFIQEATALRVTGGAGYAVDLGGSSGNASISTANGALTIAGALRSTGATGNVSMRSGEAAEPVVADVDVRANLSSTSGSISIIAADSILVDNGGVGAPRIETLAAGRTLDLSAVDAISMEATAQLQTNNGNLRIEAIAGSVSLGMLGAGTSVSGGTISINAGSVIADAAADDLTTPAGINLAAYALRLQAGGGIGVAGAVIETQVSVMAVAAGGSAYLAERDGVAIGTVGPVTVNRIDFSGATAALTDLAISGLNTGGGAGTNISATGNLAIDGMINAGAGNVRIDVAGALTLNASVGNGSGSITVLASGEIVQTALGRLLTSTGTIDVESTSGAIVMANGALAQTNAGNIRYRAASGITLGLLDARSAADRLDVLLTGQAGWGAVSVLAGGAVADLAADAAVNIYAGELRLHAAASIGSGSEALEVEVLRLSGAAAGVYLADQGSVIVDQTAAITVNRVLADGTIAGSSVTDALQANLVSSAALVLQAGAGSITSGAAGAISASGNLLLAATGDIVLAGAVANSSASTSINAGRDLLQNAAISSSFDGASIDLRAARHLVQANASTLTSSNGNVSLSAGMDVTLESIAAGTGAVRVAAGNDVIDGDLAGDAEVDIAAAALQLAAGNALGSGVNALETSVAVLSASAGAAGLYVSESDGLAVDTLVFQVSRVTGNGLAALTTGAVQSNLSASGNVVLASASGDLVISDDVSAAFGSVLLKASSGGMTLNSSITTGTGSVSLSASASIVQKAAISSAASVDISAGVAVSMDDGVLTSAGGNVRYAAAGALALGAISAANVSLQAASITDSGTSDIDVSTGALRLVTTGLLSGDGAGSSTQHLQIAAGTLAANVAGAGGLYLDESNALVIGNVAAISIARLAANGTSSSVTDSAMADLVSGGNLVLSSAGTITVDSSLSSAAINLVGNLLLQAAGAGSDLILNGALLSSAGNLSLNAGRDISLASTISTSAAGKTLDLVAARSLAMAQGSLLSTNNGAILAQAGQDATVETLSAGTASISLRAITGDIVDGDSAGDVEADILAGALQVRAGGAVGSAFNHLETIIGTLTGQTGAGGIYINESNALVVDTLTVQASRVGMSGVSVLTLNAAQSNLQSGGDIIVISNAGSLAISDNVNAAGNVRLQASSGGLVINNAVTSSGGAVSLASSGAIVQHANIGVSGGGSIELAATGSVAMDNGTSISGNASIRVAAGTVMTLGAVRTSGSVSLSAGSISDAGNVETDVVAAQLRLVTTSTGNTGAGLAGSHLQLNVGTLALVSSGVGGVYLDEANDITIGAVGDIAVTRVNADGSVSSVIDAGFSDLVSAGNVVLVTTAGGITVTDGDADNMGISAAGNLLLQAGGADIVASAVVFSAGNVSLNAGRDLVQNAGINSNGAGKTVDVLAVRDIAMSAGTTLASNGGSIAAQAGNNITVATIDAGSASVRVAAGANLIDGDGAGDSGADILAGSLQLVAGNAIGSGANALETSVATLAGQAGGAIYLRDSDSVTVDTVAVQIQRVDGRGAVAVTSNAAQANLSAGADLVLVAASGTLTISDAISAGASVLLQASMGDINVNSAVGSTVGSVSLWAAGAIAQKAGIVGATTVEVAAGGAIGMDDGISTSAQGNVRYAAGGTLALGSIVSAADVSLVAAAIIDSGTGDTDVSANALRLHTLGAGAGTSAAHLQAALNTLGGSVAGSLYLDAVGALAINSIAPIAVSRLAADGSISIVTDLPTAGLTAGDSIALTAAAITQAAQISSTGRAGSVTLVASADISMAPAALTRTDQGAISYSAGGQITVSLLDARSSVERASETSSGQGDWGVVSLTAGTVQDGNHTDVDVMASRLVVNAASAGSGTDLLDTEVVSLVANIGAGGLYLSDASSLALAGVTVGGDAILRAAQDVSIVGATTVGGALLLNAGSFLVTHAQLTVGGDAGLDAIGDASVNAMLTVSGALQLHAGANVDVSGAVTVASFAVLGAEQDIALNAALTVSGNLLLHSGRAVMLQADVHSSAGSISVSAGTSIAQSGALATLGQGQSIDLVAAGAIRMASGASSTTSNGNVAVHAFDIALGAISAGSGSVSLVADGAISDAQAATDHQFIKVHAAGLRLTAGGGIGSVTNPIETVVGELSALAAGGELAIVDTDGLTVNAAGVAVSVNRVGADGRSAVATDAAVPGVVAAAGNIALAANSGAVVFEVALTNGAGRDLSVVGDFFSVTEALAGDGGRLLIMPSNPALGIQIGGAAGVPLHLDAASLANLTGGFEAVVIGGGDLAPGQDIAIDGRVVPVVLPDTLVLNVSGPGSVISVAGQLTAEALEARAGVIIVGVVTVSSGNAALAGGDMLFNESVDGATGNDHLTLNAGGDSIVFGGPLGAATALASLTIGDAVNVSFSEAVTVNGNVVINASGVVRFDGLLTLQSGSLVIQGATEVIIGDVILHGVNGQFVIEANSLTLNGDVTGATCAVLRPSDMSRDIVVGGTATGAFSISAAMLAHLSGAGQLVIGVAGSDGHAAAGAGNVTLAPIDLGAITAAPVKVFGTFITLEQGAGSLAASSITLDGRSGVLLHDSVAASAGDVVIRSVAGAVTMDNGTAISSNATVLLEAASTLGVGEVSAQHVTLRSASGGIVDVNGDAAVNVTAARVSLYGYGAPVGAGNPIEVQAPSIFLAAPSGIELQDTGPDGRTHFYVLDGATMYEQAVGIGEAVRTTLDPVATPAFGASLPAPVGELASLVSHAPGRWGGADTEVARYLAAMAAGERSSAVLADSGAGIAAGVSTAATFDFWLADLVV